jgi:hypothetical protein
MTPTQSDPPPDLAFHKPLCPRCDYDLAGEVATWAQQCPLSSRCPECGLDVRWTSVYRAEKPPSWSVEHADKRTRTIVWAAIRSAFRAFVPGLLWRRLSLSMPVVPRRLAVMLALWMILGYALAVVIMAASDYVAHRAAARVFAEMLASNPGAWGQYPPYSLTQDLWRTFFPFFSIAGSQNIPPQPVAMALLFTLTVPAALVLLPFSLRRAKVRQRHLVRLVAYWLVWIPPAAIFPAWTGILLRTLDSTATIVGYRLGRSDPWLARAFRDASESIADHSTLLATALVFLAVAWFWRQACRYYLRLPRPTLVSLGIVTLSLLLTAAAGFFIIPGADDFVIQVIYEAFGK